MDPELGAPAEVTVIPTEPPVTATPSAEAPSPSPADGATAKDPAKPESRRDVIERAMKNPTNRGKHAAYQPRESGKFAPGAPQVPVSAPVVEPDLPMPKDLKKEVEAHWKTAAKELKEAVIQRHADYEKGVSQWKPRAEQADALLNEFKPYEWILKNEGTTPQAAIAPLLQTAAILRTGTPVQKAQAVASTMRQWGIPLEHIQQLLGQAQHGALLDPQYNQLAQEVQSLRQAQQSQEQVRQQRTMTVIEQFASDIANVHFSKLQPQMLALLQTPQLLGPDAQYMSEPEKLKRAYEVALRLDPELAAQALAQQQAEAARQQREKAQAAANVAKAAAVQVRGAPGSPLQTAVNPTDRRSVIANALRATQT